MFCCRAKIRETEWVGTQTDRQTRERVWTRFVKKERKSKREKNICRKIVGDSQRNTEYEQTKKAEIAIVIFFLI